MFNQGPKVFLIGSALVLAIAPVWAQSSGSGGSGGSTGSSAGAASRGASPAARSGAATSTAPLTRTTPGATGMTSTTAPATAGSSDAATTPNPGRLESASPTDPNLTPRSVPNAGTPTGQALGTTPLRPNSTGGDSTVPLSTDNSRTAAGAASGGRAVGARANTLDDCMATWDAKTHVSKARWREICARTLKEPHL